MTGTSGRILLDLWKHLESAHAGHVDVRQDQDQRRIRDRLYLFQRSRGRQSKLHDETPRAQIASELLAEHALDIGLVIDDDNIGAQFVPPAVFGGIIVRGSVIINSVKIPGLVSTSILPRKSLNATARSVEGHLADMPGLAPHVRCTPEGGHLGWPPACPLCAANSGSRICARDAHPSV